MGGRKTDNYQSKKEPKKLLEDGCLPPFLQTMMSIEEMRDNIIFLSSDDLRNYNPSASCGEDVHFSCLPYHIIGFTQDNQVAYCGINYIGALPFEELNSLLDLAMINSTLDKDKKIIKRAKVELEALLVLKDNVSKL